MLFIDGKIRLKIEKMRKKNNLIKLGKKESNQILLHDENQTKIGPNLFIDHEDKIKFKKRFMFLTF